MAKRNRWSGRSHKDNGNSEMVTALLSLGCTYSEVAKELKMSRNAIAGIVWRSERRPERKITPKQKVAQDKQPQPVSRKVDMSEPVSLALEMEDLRTGQCKYPQGDNPFTFCGQIAIMEKPYCPYHWALTHQAGSAISSQNLVQD